jgi:hypothetical protein
VGDIVSTLIGAAVRYYLPVAFPGIGTFASAIIGGIVSFGVGALFAKKPKEPDAGASSFAEDQARGISQNITNPVQALPVIYGETRIAGSRVFAEVSGANGLYLHQVIAFAEGEIESFDAVYFDDIDSTDARFSGLVDFGDGMNAHLGTDTQAADSQLVSRLASWTADHQLKGVAYLYVRLSFSPEVFPSVPTISADISGKKVFHVTAGGAPAFSQNPANCIYDYLTNTRYGRGIPTSEIDLASFQAAESICDVVVDSIPRYACDGVLNVDNSSLDNIRDLLSSCRAMLIFTGGLYRIKIDQAETPGFTFNEDNITGEFRIALDGKQRRFNRIRARYFNDNRKYQPDIFVVDNPTYRGAGAPTPSGDYGTLLEEQISLPFTINEKRVKRMAELELNQSRFTIGVEFNATLEGLRAEVGDVVKITHSTPGWTNKAFRILAIDMDGQDSVRIRAQEYSATVFTPGPPPTITAPPTVTFPPVQDTTQFVEPVSSWLYSFEKGDTAGWIAGDGTIATTADACVGDVAGLVTHGGGGNIASVSIAIPPSFANNVLANTEGFPTRQVRLQMWAKRPTANAATGFKVRLVGSSEDSGWQTFATTGPPVCETLGFVWKPTTSQTSMTLEIQGDSNDAGTGATIIDNITLFAIPDFIDTDTIDTWIGVGAVGNAYIADAAITNAKIGVAEIGTLTVAGNAITVQETSEASVSACPTDWTSTGVSITRAAVSNRQGLIIFLEGEGFISCYHDVDDDGGITSRLLRDGQVMTEAGSITFDEPDDDAHTYTLEYKHNNPVQPPTYQSGTVTFRMAIFEGLR